MNRLYFFLPLFCFSAPALAEVCILVEDDAARLACFDASVRCSSIESDRDRLQCFDRVYDPAYDSVEPQIEQAADASGDTNGDMTVAAEQPEPNNPEDAAGDSVAAVAASSPENFGKREPAEVRREEYIEATIVEIRTTGLKIDYLRLDNGQVWREVSDSRIRFKEGRGVKITEGVLGSFDLQMEGYNRVAKVRRVN